MAHSPPTPGSSHTKANLNIRGNLDTAKYEWSLEDMTFQYRIVYFTCIRTDNNTVVADFHFASARQAHELKQQGHPIISCLYSQSMRKWYFIGTEALTALERILDVELGDYGRKVSRNKFDSYGPITQRNTRDDLDDIFYLIENTERLKPRNVKKGVRIYRWEELTNFLQGLARSIDLRPLDSSPFFEQSDFVSHTGVGWHPPHSLATNIYQQPYLEMNVGPHIHSESIDMSYPAALYSPVYEPVATIPQYQTIHTAAPLYMMSDNVSPMYNAMNLVYDPEMQQQQQYPSQWH